MNKIVLLSMLILSLFIISCEDTVMVIPDVKALSQFNIEVRPHDIERTVEAVDRAFSTIR